MSERKRAKKGPVKQSIFPKVRFPSDNLTLGQLRASWPAPEDLAALIRAVRVMEEDVALLAVLPKGQEIATDPLIKPDVDKNIKDLTDFYVYTGLATGPHAPQLLIGSIEEQARRLYAKRTR